MYRTETRQYVPCTGDEEHSTEITSLSVSGRVREYNISGYGTIRSTPLVHGTYTRIDYWLIEHRMLNMVISTNIEIITLSHHAPLTMKIKIPEAQRQEYSWRLNEDLLDKQGEEIIEKELEQ